MGSFALWRPVLRRDRADLAVSAAAAVLLLAATTLVVSAVMYGEAVATGSLRRALELAPAEARAVVVRTTVTAEYAATWTRSQADQAAFQAAADVRVTTSRFGALEPWAAGAAFLSLPGVAAAMGVEARALDSGKSVRGGTLLALDPSAAPGIVALSQGADGDAARAALARLGAARVGSRPGASGERRARVVRP